MFPLKTRSLVSHAAAALMGAGAALILPAHSARAQQTPIAAPYAAPALIGGGPTVNGKPASLVALRGKVVLVAFWTRGCINCKRTIPYWNQWAKNAGNDFAVVSVHTPEGTWERPASGVAAFAKEKNLRFSALIDNDARNWNAWGVESWPTTFLLDKQGRVRYKWEGELNYDNSGDFRRVEAQIALLKKEKP